MVGDSEQAAREEELGRNQDIVVTQTSLITKYEREIQKMHEAK